MNRDWELRIENCKSQSRSPRGGAVCRAARVHLEWNRPILNARFSILNPAFPRRLVIA